MIAGLVAGVSVLAARRIIAQAFRQQNLDTADLDARILLGHALGADHAGLAAAPERILTFEEALRVVTLAERRLAREPVARITGEKEFWGLALGLNAATLVPRPETETVVEAALAVVHTDKTRSQRLSVADLGTGTGALLLALLSELPHATGVGTDLSVPALALARRNGARHGLADRARFIACDLGSALGDGFDLVISNPPYIPTRDIADLAPEVSLHDPRLALDGGSDGLDCYRAIAADARRLLKPGGHLVVELGAGQADAVSGLFTHAELVCAPPRPDLSGIPRALAARRDA
jgi:release factor glutamine methyltransferase